MASRSCVSFITSAYNAASTIGETVDSVLGQTRDDWEMIIIDDGSIDETAAVAQRHAARDDRVSITRQGNAGTAAARNAGAARATGRFWCFLDADDTLQPGYIAAQAAFAAEHPGYDIYSCNAWLELRSGRRRLMWRGSRFERPLSLALEEQLQESSILLMSLLTPRVFELTGGFRDLHSEDYDFWLRAMVLGASHIYNPSSVAVYRRHAASKTTDMIAEAESFLRIHQDVLEMPELTDAQRELCRQVIAFDRARIARRMFETSILSGDFGGARGAYLRNREAYPDRLNYAVGLGLVMASPHLYGYVKKRRLV